MKTGLTLAGIAAASAVTASIVLAVTVSTQPAPTIPLLNLPVPQFDLQALDPNQAAVSSALLRQSGPTVINFWGIVVPTLCRGDACAPGGASRTRRQGAIRGHRRGGHPGAALRFLHHVGVTYPSGFDGNGAVADAFDLEGTPTTYFVSHGKMLDFHTGRMTKKQLLTYLQQIFGVT